MYTASEFLDCARTLWDQAVQGGSFGETTMAMHGGSFYLACLRPVPQPGQQTFDLKKQPEVSATNPFSAPLGRAFSVRTWGGRFLYAGGAPLS